MSTDRFDLSHYDSAIQSCPFCEHGLVRTAQVLWSTPHFVTLLIFVFVTRTAREVTMLALLMIGITLLCSPP